MSGLNCSAVIPLHPGKKPVSRAWKAFGAGDEKEGEDSEHHLARNCSGDSSYMCELTSELQNRKGRAKLGDPQGQA